MHRKLNTVFSNGIYKVKHSKGFTLTEVAVASMLLIIATVPILKALSGGNLNSAIIERKTRSLVLAQAKLNEIAAKSIYDYNAAFAESDTSLGGSYLCNVVDSSAGINLRTISVSVGFDLNQNSSLSADETEVNLVTHLARRW